MSRFIFSVTLLPTLFALVAVQACKRRGFNSTPQEAPGAADRPEKLGLPATMSWNDLKDVTKGERVVPWTDTYWPLFEKGMASRWSMNKKTQSNLSKAPDTPYEQVSQMLDAWSRGDKAALDLLSPAEKYALVKMGNNAPDKRVLDELQRYDKTYRESPALKDSREQVERLTQEQNALKESYRNHSKQVNNLIGRVRDDNESLIRYRSYLKSRDLQGRINRQEVQQKISELQVQMTRTIESIRTTQAAIERDEKAIVELHKKRSEAKSAYEKELKKWQGDGVSVVSQMTGPFSMMGTGWSNYLQYSSSYDEPWEWMGHCHGWAVAALNEEAPKHGVLVRSGGKELFFSEGDIRGLMTKVYSDQAPPAQFASLRCNSEKMITDRLGRVADGKLCMGNSINSCSQNDKGEVVYIATGQSQRGLTVFSTKLNDDSPRVAVWTGGSGEDSVQVMVYPSLESFSKNIDKIRAGDYSDGQKAVLNISTSCRDTNPMTLHMALKGLIVDKKIGFVMDRTRTAQVWNQPVHKFEVTHLPIKKNDAGGTLSAPGEPVPVAEVDDLFRDYRAKGTAYLVQVKTKLHYGVENGPKLRYQPNDEATDVDTVFYTLELDSKRNLIGGEWGLIPTTENARESSLASGRSGTAPDFLWLIEQKNKPTSGELDYALIDRIHACSLQSEKSGQYSPSGSNVSLSYVDCPLD